MNSKSHTQIIPIDDLRIKLARAYESEGQFTLMEPDDSVNAFRALLAAIHSSAVGDRTQGLDHQAAEIRCDPPCPAHKAFYIELIQQRVCSCGGSSEANPWSFSSFTIPCYVSPLLQEYNRNTTYLTNISDRNLGSQISASNAVKCKGKLMAFIKSTLSERLFQCAAEDPNCKSKDSRNESYLVSMPKLIGVNLTWPSAMPLPSEILKVLAAIPVNFNISEILRSEENFYEIYGLIIFGLNHYNGVFYNEESKQWILYDDSCQRVVGSNGNFLEMILTCVERNFYPVLIFYKSSSIISEFEEEIEDIDWVVLERLAASHDLDYSENIEFLRSLEASRAQPYSVNSREPPQFEAFQSQGANKLDELARCSVCKLPIHDVEHAEFPMTFCRQCRPS